VGLINQAPTKKTQQKGEDNLSLVLKRLYPYVEKMVGLINQALRK
jgi:hypothetical protein